MSYDDWATWLIFASLAACVPLLLALGAATIFEFFGLWDACDACEAAAMACGFLSALLFVVGCVVGAGGEIGAWS